MTDYERIRAILDAATPGPWYDEPQKSAILEARVGSEGHRRGVGDFAIFVIPEKYPVDEWDETDPAHPDADARAIVVSRNLAPELLAVAEAARAVADGWRDYVEAQAGRGHIGQVHTSESVLEGGCGRCAGAQYGTEVAMNEYVVPVLRAALDVLDAKIKETLP